MALGAATLAGGLTARRAWAQGTVAAAPPAPFTFDAYSRNLQWCRTPTDLGKAVADLGLTSVDLNIAAYPGHVDPARAKTDLPTFVEGLKAQGVTVRCITTPITGADSPDAEALLDAAASAGVQAYTWSGAPLEDGKPWQAQVDSLKARFAALAKLNQKHRIKGLYQPRPDAAGALFVDLLPALQGLDPRYTGVRYDTAALLQARPENVVRHLRLGGAYIGGVALNDAAVSLELPVWKQGDFDDDPALLTRPDGGGDNLGNAGGNWLAYGGGGRPLPYRYRPTPVGTGMVDLTLVGKTLKEIGFSGPVECQAAYDLGGAETGADKIALPRQEVIGRLKRDRITVEHALYEPWGLPVQLPPFMRKGAGAAPRPQGAGAGGPPPDQ
jgi:sugar phosphate isomerase/epimerase